MRTLAIIISAALLLLQKDQLPESGCWEAHRGDSSVRVLLTEGYLTLSVYKTGTGNFFYSYGGPAQWKNGQLELQTQFDSRSATLANQARSYPAKWNGSDLELEIANTKLSFESIDGEEQELVGNWRISKRKREEEWADMPLRARRTLKLLSGTHFQWVAINIETGEFSGTGAGRYEFNNGKYTEHIEFFSRDDSRVGMSLTFDGKLEGNDWFHSGKSSKGDEIAEVWTRKWQ